jgi:[Skp1-protein]-hydroxyproline N-acetylglucosaminyltransferase
MGAASGHWKDESVRGDKIKWLTTVDMDGMGPLKISLQRMHSILSSLQKRIRPRSEFFTKAIQVAYYGPNGAQYSQHSDVSPLIPTRRLTFILYLRETPKVSNPGGHLRLQTLTGASVDIAPKMNRMVIFRSNLLHQVLPSYFDRYAMTLWAHNQDMLESRDYLQAAKQPTIFVSVPAYRDPDTNKTIENLFDAATYPERIKVGVLYQDAKDEPWTHSEIPHRYQNYVEALHWSNEDARGPFVARAVIQEQLFSNEDYYMQIDSHMRFAQGWDEDLLHILSKCHDPHKSVLSTYPPTIMNDTLVPIPGPVLLYPTHFDSDGMLRIKGTSVEASESPISNMFAAAGFLFSSGKLIYDLPYDKTLEYLFFGEETLLSLSIWVKGWSIYSPWCESGYGTTCWHQWDRSYRRTLWQDFGNSESMINKRSDAQQKVQAYVQQLKHENGNQNERTLSSFEKAAGVIFEERRVVFKLQNENDIQHQSEAAGKFTENAY